MALIACGECGQKVSTEAKACPGCGAKVKKPVGLLGKLFAAAVLIAIVQCTLKTQDRPPATPSPAKAKASPEEDQHVREVVGTLRSLRSLMHDPQSFDVESATRAPDGSICIVYRGKNAFGAVVRNRVVAWTGGSSEDDLEFSRRCIGTGAVDYTAARHLL